MKLGLDFEYVYHERQEASLCGVHCLNSLLQGNYFSAVELMEIAQQFDQTERQIMGEFGTETAEYLRYMAEESGNVADDGNYSVQVLETALKIWNLSLVSLTSEGTHHVRSNPLQEQGFICNLQSHWFAIRKIGSHWFDLNSLKKNPENISEFYLTLYLETLLQQGYSIFMVRGTLPTPIDHPLAVSTGLLETTNQFNPNPLLSPPNNRWHVVYLRRDNHSHNSNSLSTDYKYDEDDELQKGIAMSLSMTGQPQEAHRIDNPDKERKRKRMQDEELDLDEQERLMLALSLSQMDPKTVRDDKGTAANLQPLTTSSTSSSSSSLSSSSSSPSSSSSSTSPPTLPSSVTSPSPSSHSNVNSSKTPLDNRDQKNDNVNNLSSGLTTNLMFRLPNGSRLQQRFSQTDTLEVVFQYLSQMGVEGEYRLLTTPPPKLYDRSEQGSQTLAQLSLVPSCLMVLEKKC